MSTDTPPVSPDPTRNHLLSDQQYHTLNILAMVVFPAIGTLYFALAKIWGLPDATEVVGSIVAIDAFLGVLVKAGEASYDQSGARFGGAINVSQQAEKTVYTLELDHDPEELVDRDHVTFKVKKPKALPPPPVSSVILNP